MKFDDHARRLGCRGLLAGAMLMLGGCFRALPEPDTASAQLYKERCGACHHAYQPSSMTAAMWQTQVNAMEIKMADAGQPPLTADEQRAILDYLRRNAGTQ